MTWDTNRAQQLPNDWNKRRQAALERAQHQCEVTMQNGERCPETTRLEVDHLERGNNHELSNLGVKCNWHHTRKTQQEARQAKKLNKKPSPGRHPGEVHPAFR